MQFIILMRLMELVIFQINMAYLITLGQQILQEILDLLIIGC